MVFKQDAVLGALVVAFLIPAIGRAQKPELAPSATLEQHAALIKKGVALHDEGDYDGAIAAYQEVLSENPDDVTAQFELSYSYFQKRDYDSCIKTARKGTTYISDLLSHFYMYWGSCLDDSGKPKRAIGVYERALKSAPDHPRLHFNIGVTYRRMGKSDKAKTHFKRTLVRDPGYVSAHFALAHEYIEANQSIPALLALLRFLVLEPSSTRTGKALTLLKSVLGSQVEEKEEGKILVTLDPNNDTREGDFSDTEVMLAISRAGQFIEERRDHTDLEKMVDQLGSLFAFMDETHDPKDTGFAMEYYVPYFVELGKNDFQEVLVHYIHQSSETPGASDWLDANHQQVKRFEDWSRGYQNWPIEVPDK